MRRIVTHFVIVSYQVKKSMKKFFEVQLAISISISFPKQQSTFQSTIAWGNKIYLELIYIEIGGMYQWNQINYT